MRTILLILSVLYSAPALSNVETLSSRDVNRNYHISTQEEFITTYQNNGRHFFKIPRSVLGKDLLFVSRLSGNAYKYDVYGPSMEVQKPIMIYLEKRGKSIWIRVTKPDIIIKGDKPIYESVQRNNTSAVLHSLEIESINENSDIFAVDVTDFFSSEIPWVNPHDKYGISGFDRARSSIVSVESFSNNVEIKQIVTYRALNVPGNPSKFLSIELNHSIVLLPEDQMIPRIYNPRLSNVHTIERIDYGVEPYIPKTNRYVCRWRLEPSDWSAFKNGGLVNPVKPIIYYIDPATPQKWKPYIRKGIEDWNKAFEQDGFNNAILVRDAPSKEEDPNWNIDDFRYSCIRYITGTAPSHASTIFDPRTGEILNASIQLGHEKLAQLRNRFFVQTAASNPAARGTTLSERVMGELIRQIISHEVGHTLGFYHNAKASNSYSIDSLRSPSFTATHGLSPSIMDYAWGNYIAQPNDGVENFYTKIGEYDMWAIWYIYRPIYGVVAPEDEFDTLNKWQTNREFITQGLDGADHDLGDNAIKASSLGINNLKLIVKNLIDWSGARDRSELTDIYQSVLEHYKILLEDVAEELEVPAEETACSHEAILDFVNQYLFDTPTWVVSHDVQNTIQSSFVKESIFSIQEHVLKTIISKINRMTSNQESSRTTIEKGSILFKRLRNCIFKELEMGIPIEPQRRNLQEMTLNIMIDILTGKAHKSFSSYDLEIIMHSNLSELDKMIMETLKYQKDDMSRHHLLLLQSRIKSVKD